MSATKFVWKGKNAKGENVSGEYEANDSREVGEFLRKRKIVITSIKKKPKDIELKFLQKKGVGVKDLSVFTRQFATMVNAGLPLVQCLDVLGRQLDKQHFKEVVQKVTADVEGGSTLAEALEKHPPVFSDLYVNMVAAGEAGVEIFVAGSAVFRAPSPPEAIRAIRRAAEQQGIPVDDSGLPEGARQLVALAFAVREREGARRSARDIGFLEAIGAKSLRVIGRSRELVALLSISLLFGALVATTASALPFFTAGLELVATGRHVRVEPSTPTWRARSAETPQRSWTAELRASRAVSSIWLGLPKLVMRGRGSFQSVG